METVPRRGNLVPRQWLWDPSLNIPARFRRGCRYEAFMPDPISGFAPVLPGTISGAVSDAETSIAQLNSAARPELLPLARLLLRTESIASSRVEGLQVDARTLARAEARRDSGRSIGPESAEILANVDAMVLAVGRASEAAAITEDNLLAIHRELLGRSHPRIAGRFRSVQNWLGGNDHNPCGADFVPPPPEEVPRLLADLCAFCTEETLPPLVQAAIAHAQFETIHPFEDGNGRSGRALVQVILRRRGLARSFLPPISVVLAQDTRRYVDGLTRYREDRVGEWVEMFAAAAARAAVLAQTYLGSVSRLQDAWRRQLRHHSGPRADAAAWDLIRVLPSHPFITIAAGVAATSRSRPAVSGGLGQLQAAGVITRTGTSARNLVWEATGVLDLVEGLESRRRTGDAVDGFRDDDGLMWPFYSEAALRVGSRAVLDLTGLDAVDVGDHMPSIIPGISEVVVRRVPSPHGTHWTLLVRVPTGEAIGERAVVLQNARRRAGMPHESEAVATPS